MDRSVMVFAPSPQLTVTVEERGGEPDLHLHAGGQGVWQARMIASLGLPVTMCAAFGGETGQVAHHLAAAEGIELAAVQVAARNGGYVHDRRDGRRTPLVEAPGDPLARHELDDLYESALVHGLRAGVAVLSGPADPRLVPAQIYRRLAADLTANGVCVLADLCGDALDAVVAGGPSFVKVSHEELLADGRVASADRDDLIDVMRKLRGDGAGAVLVSRAAEPSLALLHETLHEVRVPLLEPTDTRGAGDSMTGAVAAAIALGETWEAAVALGAAAGALNVTRRGLATGGGDSVRWLAGRVQLQQIGR